MTNHYVLRFHTYSGMYYDMECSDERNEVRSAAAKRIRDGRKRQPVHILENGSRWEFETPERAFMIGDYDGTMVLLEIEQHDELDIDEFNEAYEESYDLEPFE